MSVGSMQQNMPPECDSQRVAWPSSSNIHPCEEQRTPTQLSNNFVCKLVYNYNYVKKIHFPVLLQMKDRIKTRLICTG